MRNRLQKYKISSEIKAAILAHDESMIEYKVYKYETCEYCDGNGSRTYTIDGITSNVPCGYCIRGKKRTEVDLESAMIEVLKKSFRLASLIGTRESD